MSCIVCRAIDSRCDNLQPIQLLLAHARSLCWPMNLQKRVYRDSVLARVQPRDLFSTWSTLTSCSQEGLSMMLRHRYHTVLPTGPGENTHFKMMSAACCLCRVCCVAKCHQGMSFDALNYHVFWSNLQLSVSPSLVSKSMSKVRDTSVGVDIANPGRQVHK